MHEENPDNEASGDPEAGDGGKKPALTDRPEVVRRIWIAVGVVGLLAVLFAFAARDNSTPETKGTGDYFGTVLDACEIPRDSMGASILDGGTALALHSEGEKTPGLSIAEVGCALAATKIPESTIHRMSETRAIDGRQSDSWDGFEAEWSYHPDLGLSILIKDTYRGG
ncbi:MAG: hypothetical protein Q4P36_04880 [Bowdeniella nasicola]|nr:hypothetical protein [Bowdeniella nasicola]